MSLYIADHDHAIVIVVLVHTTETGALASAIVRIERGPGATARAAAFMNRMNTEIKENPQNWRKGARFYTHHVIGRPTLDFVQDAAWRAYKRRALDSAP